MKVNEIVLNAHENAVNKGFWEDTYIIHDIRHENGITKSQKAYLHNNAVSTRLMLAVSELGEGLEALREGDMDGFKEELADVVIRIADLCGGLGIDLEKEILRKMDANESRSYKHGKKF